MYNTIPDKVLAGILREHSFNIDHLKKKISTMGMGDLLIFCIRFDSRASKLGRFGAYCAQQLKPVIEERQKTLLLNPNEYVTTVGYAGNV